MIKKLSSSILLGFLTILLLFSCSVEENLNLSPTNQEIEKVKNWFENNSNSLNLKIIQYTKEIQWDKAIITNGEKGLIIEIPITLKDFIATTSSTDKKQKNYHRLLFTKNENETYNCFDLQIITSEANFDNLDQNFNYYSIKDDFNGYIIFYDPAKEIVGSQRFKNGKRPESSLTGRLDQEMETCTYLVWIYEDGSYERIALLYCSRNAGGDVPGGFTGGYGGGGTPNPVSPTPEVNPCDKIKTLKADPNYINAVAELNKNFKLQHETGYYISESNGYEAATPVGNLQLNGKYVQTLMELYTYMKTISHIRYIMVESLEMKG